jgi:hypothetical protein
MDIKVGHSHLVLMLMALLLWVQVTAAAFGLMAIKDLLLHRIGLLVSVQILLIMATN